MDNRKVLQSFSSTALDSVIKSIVNDKIKKVREDILLGEIIFQPEKIHKNNTNKKKKDSETEENLLNGINDQIIKNMQKSFKISVANIEKKKLVIIFYSR
jgi:hypothetical protein